MWNYWWEGKVEILAEEVQPIGLSMGSTDPRRQESDNEAETTRCYTTQLQNGLLFLQLLLFNHTEVTSYIIKVMLIQTKCYNMKTVLRSVSLQFSFSFWKKKKKVFFLGILNVDVWLKLFNLNYLKYKCAARNSAFMIMNARSGPKEWTLVQSSKHFICTVNNWALICCNQIKPVNRLTCIDSHIHLHLHFFSLWPNKNFVDEYISNVSNDKLT